MAERLRPLLYLLLIGLLLLACRKDNLGSDVDADPILSPTTGTRKELTLDSIFLYAKQTYLWQEVLPPYPEFKPRERYGHLTPEATAYTTELFDIAQMKINPATGRPYEENGLVLRPRYSAWGGPDAIGPFSASASSPQSGNTVTYHAVIPSQSGDIAYLVLAGFPKLSDCQQELDWAFSGFADAGIKKIIIDLRNNGGGYLETATHVADLVAPATINGKVMYTERFNALMQAGNATILQYQPYLDGNGKQPIFQGRPATMADVDFSAAANTFWFSTENGPQDITDVCFIVSGATASTAEMLISCFKPYLNVSIVGERTYGKPVGTFGIRIGGHRLFLASFLITNASGWSDYFNGMEPHYPVWLPENPSWGDANEAGLATAIAGLASSEKPLKSSSRSPNHLKIPDSRQENHPVPMIPNTLKLRDMTLR